MGVLEPGARLNIEALKREQKVSHPSIREALAQLVGEGYVSIEGNKGYRVLESSFGDLADTTRLRAELECLGLTWSIDNTDTDWRARVIAAHHALSEVEAEMLNDPVAFAIEWDERNKQFHGALIANSNSPRLIETASTLYDLTRRYRLMAYSSMRADHRGWLQRSRREHDALKTLALSGDAERACSILRTHVTKSSDAAGAVVFTFEDAKNKKKL